MSFSYDNKVLTGIQWGRRMHGDPRAFQTLSERVCGDSVAGGNRRTCLLLLYMVPHGPHLYEGSRMRRIRSMRKFPEVIEAIFLEIYVPKKKCLSTS